MWGILFPSVILVLNSGSIDTESDIFFWWLYIIVSSFVYGIGLFALEQRDSGILATIFSIKWVPVQYFMGCLYTQITYSFICVSVFNLFAFFLTGLNFWILMFYATIGMVVCLPIAFISFNFTRLRNVKVSTVQSIINIMFFVFFIIASQDSFLNHLNPFLILSRICFQIINNQFPYLEISLMIITSFLSLNSIRIFEPMSREKR